MSLQRRIYEQNARLNEARRDVDITPSPEMKKMIEGGKMKVVKSAPSSLGGNSIFAVLENPKAGREDDKFVMACISDPKRGKIKIFSFHGSHPSADGAMKLAKNHDLLEFVDNPEYEPELSEESIDEMSAKAHWKTYQAKFIVPPINRERHPNREKEGLEGPYRVKKSGLIFYYDKKEGKYYDPQSDMYLQVKDVLEAVEQVDELTEKFEFQFPDKESSQKFMREIMHQKLGSSTGTTDGKVTAQGPTQAGIGSPTRAHQQMAKIMKKFGGKIISTDEGPRMKKVFKEEVEQVDEMNYLGKDKKFGRKFYEKGGQLHVVVNNGKPQNLGSVEVKGNAKMIRGLVKEESIDLDEKLQIKLKSKFKPSSGGSDVNKIFDVIIDGVRVGIMTKETSDDHNYGDGGSYMSFKILQPGSRNKYAEKIHVDDVEDPNDFFKQLKKDPRTAKRTIKALKAHGVELTNINSKHESVEFVESVKEDSIDEAVFSKSQLDKLRAEYSKIKTVDPSQPTYGKLTAFLDKLDDAKLKQLATAKIKFVSGLAHNRVTKRTMK
jgi:hypothetical protein